MPSIDEAFLAAVQLHQSGRLLEAEAAYQQILSVMPEHAEAWLLVGTAAFQRGDRQRAKEWMGRAIALKPDFAEAYLNLASVLQELSENGQAIACYRKAIELAPTMAEAHNNLGNALQQQMQLDEAIECYERALAIKPEFAEAHYNLGNAWKSQHRLDEAIDCYRKALELKPSYARAEGNLLLALHYGSGIGRSGITLAELADAHAEYERKYAAGLKPICQPRIAAGNLNRKLRLGFVSPDLKRHPVAYFLIALLENLDREQCSSVCYSDTQIADEVTSRIRSCGSLWRDVRSLSDEQLAQCIRDDAIDILFDLAGHTGNNRLLVFARKPAPVQITWCGYSSTTGLTAIDYILADRHVIPEWAEPFYSEQVLRMPDCYLCYTPPPDAPEVSALPAEERGFITFGCFNNPSKIRPEVVAAWCEVLKRVPQSRMALKYRGIEAASNVTRLKELFTRHGVDPSRVTYESPGASMLARYAEIDIALDTFPFSGCTTTCEALWMGVPVITVPGETFASRHALSLLSAAGMTDTIAKDPDEYVALAEKLAADGPRLTKLRKSLRERVAGSAICDGALFAKNLLAILKEAWRRRIDENAATE
jgi:protein O-GlcNAc transferase